MLDDTFSLSLGGSYFPFPLNLSSSFQHYLLPLRLFTFGVTLLHLSSLQRFSFSSLALRLPPPSYHVSPLSYHFPRSFNILLSSSLSVIWHGVATPPTDVSVIFPLHYISFITLIHHSLHLFHLLSPSRSPSLTIFLSHFQLPSNGLVTFPFKPRAIPSCRSN